MEVKIGVQHAARELTIDASASLEEIERMVGETVEGGAPLVLTDTKGRKTIVPADRIAYVEIGSGSAGQVGFRS